RRIADHPAGGEPAVARNVGSGVADPRAHRAWPRNVRFWLDFGSRGSISLIIRLFTSPLALSGNPNVLGRYPLSVGWRAQGSTMSKFPYWARSLGAPQGLQASPPCVVDLSQSRAIHCLL